MSAAFTPGPWAYFTDVERGYFIDTAIGNESSNDYVIADNIRGKQSSANARLIAAAPDLYAALDAACRNSEKVRRSGANRAPRIERLWQQAQAALAKARGEQSR